MPELNLTLWSETLRPNLHNPSNWSKAVDNVKLVYVPTNSGFCGSVQMNQFCSKFEKHIFIDFLSLESVNCSIDTINGRVTDEFVLTWIQKASRMDWMLPGIDFPLQKYRCSFVISAQVDTSGKLENVRAYWDQASLLLQAGILFRSLKSLIKPGNLDALESTLNSLPIYSDYAALLREDAIGSCKTELPAIGALNNISSILHELPRSNGGLAVSTPQMPARSRSINPALMGTLKFDNDQPFDSPLPANTRSVKSRNIFSNDNDQESSSSVNYHPGLASNARFLENAQSHIFESSKDESKKSVVFHPSLNLNENYIHQYESKIFNDPATRSPTKERKNHNLAQTDKILFESHVFDSMNPDHNISDARVIKHVATAPPQCPSLIISPEEDLKVKAKTPSSTLSRPGMLGHFQGSAIGARDGVEDEQGRVKFIPSTAIRFNPNQSQIVIGDPDGTADLDENSRNYQNRSVSSSTRKPVYDPNRSQIFMGDYSSSSSNK